MTDPVEPLASAPVVEVYRDRAFEWRWRHRAANGKVVADSGEGYVTKWNAKRAARKAFPSVTVRVR